MKTLAGQESQVHFTHLSKSSCDTLTSRFQLSTSGEGAPAFAHTEGVTDFIRRKGIPLEKVCLLDPKAEKPLAPEDGSGLFECFLFGVSEYIFQSLHGLGASLSEITGHSWYVVLR